MMLTLLTSQRFSSPETFFPFKAPTPFVPLPVRAAVYAPHL